MTDENIPGNFNICERSEAKQSDTKCHYESSEGTNKDCFVVTLLARAFPKFEDSLQLAAGTFIQ
ncbi:hypothetical protein MYX76_07870 [Desulfobacterota bacterium AH_259_B03_O07]|nr:hypothetical protein [Desulfobacterota bacterium AH_259_B03_O07]